MQLREVAKAENPLDDDAHVLLAATTIQQDQPRETAERHSFAAEERRVAELYALCARPAWWSTGTGRALMDRVLARSARAGYSSITLWVLRDNRRARRFYERAGFAPDGATNVLTRLGDVLEVRYHRAL